MPERERERDLARRAVFEQLRRSGRRRWVRVSGSSMEPVMPSGGRALVEFSEGAHRVGDIVVADVGTRIVIHRIVSRPRGVPSALILKGDAERGTDPRVRVEDVYGTVLAIADRGGRMTSVGCGDSLGRALALSSRVAGRSTQLASRLERRMPAPLRSALIRPALTLAGTPLRAVIAFTIARRALVRGASA